MHRLFLLLCTIAPVWVFGQTQSPARVQFVESIEVQQAMQSYVASNRATSFIKGWRVQVLSTTDRDRLDQVRNAFRAQYPNLALTSVHNRPYYMLRAGAFTDKLDAYRLQQFLRSSYPSSYIVQDDEIEPQQLLGTVY
ncbi:MAG: SPOR domain-containing protein [Haliscomenobacter sp.]